MPKRAVRSRKRYQQVLAVFEPVSSTGSPAEDMHEGYLTSLPHQLIICFIGDVGFAWVVVQSSQEELYGVHRY